MESKNLQGHLIRCCISIETVGMIEYTKSSPRLFKKISNNITGKASKNSHETVQGKRIVFETLPERGEVRSELFTKRNVLPGCEHNVLDVGTVSELYKYFLSFEKTVCSLHESLVGLSVFLCFVPDMRCNCISFTVSSCVRVLAPRK